MAMSPRLLRPGGTSYHPEANAWKAAVVANGGSVSVSTMKAVSKFCGDIDKGGLRDRFYRLNLFCGSGLNAALVPLYRGPSRTGTQYGYTADTNNGPFVSGDYSETGGFAVTSNTSKYLATGYVSMASGDPIFTDGHIAVHFLALPSARSTVAGMRKDTSPGNQQWFQLDNTGTMWGGWCAVNKWSSSASTASAGKTLLMQNSPSANASQVYVSGGLALTGTLGAATGTASGGTSAQGCTLFAMNAELGSGFQVSQFTTQSLGSYSLGLSMTAAQALSYHNAYAALCGSIGRTIA